MAEDENTDLVKWVALAVLAITSLVITFMMSAVNVAVPKIGPEFEMGAVLLAWVVTAMTLPQAVILLPAGRLADIYGRKKIFMMGMALFIVSTFLCATATSGMMLVIFRVFQGISAGMVFGISTAIVTSVFPSDERGRALGINMAAGFIGLSAGPYLGGVLTHNLGWRSIFYISASLFLLSFFLILWKLKGEWSEAKGEKFDITGSAVFIVSITLLLYGFTKLPSTLGIVLTILGLLGMLVFVRLEMNVKSPILNIRVFQRNRVFIFSNLAMLIKYCAAFAISFLMSIFLQYIHGYTPQEAGAVLVIISVVIVFFSPVAGRLSDKYEPRKIAAMGMSLSFVAVLLLTFLNEGTPLWFIIIALVISGLGVAFFASPNTNAIMGSVERQFFGVAAGTQGTMRSTGMMMSMGVVMILFSINIGEAGITPATYPAFLTSMRTAYIIFTVLCFIGIFAQLAGNKPKQEQIPA
jgi:EmrB/QacA subfamily drug resistance transporter